MDPLRTVTSSLKASGAPPAQGAQGPSRPDWQEPPPSLAGPPCFHRTLRMARAIKYTPTSCLGSEDIRYEWIYSRGTSSLDDQRPCGNLSPEAARGDTAIFENFQDFPSENFCSFCQVRQLFPCFGAFYEDGQAPKPGSWGIRAALAGE
jgi:hypothetical protein